MNIEKLVKLNHSVNCYNHGNKRLRLGDKQGAIEYYSSAISQNPDFVEAYLNRGTAKAELGDMSGAIKDYDHTLKLNPHLASAYSNRSRAKLALGDKQGASQDYYRVSRP
jgi:tetratricopeptide (TPR) repeat protein